MRVKGEMLPDAHLIGMFRRVVKLLFWRIRPLFVFDGAAPHLKRETMRRRRAAQRRQSESATQTAHKLLRNKLKQAALKQHAAATAQAALKATDETRAEAQKETEEVVVAAAAESNQNQSEPKNQNQNDSQIEVESQNQNQNQQIVVNRTDEFIEVSDDDAIAAAQYYDDDFDDEVSYDATEAQELLGAYYQMVHRQGDGSIPTTVDPDVLNNLDERVQLEFLLGLRHLQRRETRQKIEEASLNPNSSTFSFSFSFFF